MEARARRYNGLEDEDSVGSENVPMSAIKKKIENKKKMIKMDVGPESVTVKVSCTVNKYDTLHFCFCCCHRESKGATISAKIFHDFIFQSFNLSDLCCSTSLNI